MTKHTKTLAKIALFLCAFVPLACADPVYTNDPTHWPPLGSSYVAVSDTFFNSQGNTYDFSPLMLTTTSPPGTNFPSNPFFHVFPDIQLGNLTIHGRAPNSFTGKGQFGNTGPGGQSTGTFPDQMIQLDLTLNNGDMLRIDPGPPSNGLTTITDVGGGLFRIDSFFDIFTDLSIDGGQTWIPSNSSTHIDLQAAATVPEPSTLLLVAPMLLGLGRLRKQLRKK